MTQGHDVSAKYHEIDILGTTNETIDDGSFDDYSISASGYNFASNGVTASYNTFSESDQRSSSESFVESTPNYDVTVVADSADNSTDVGGSFSNISPGSTQTSAWLSHSENASNDLSVSGNDNNSGPFSYSQSSWSIYRYHSTTTNGNSTSVVDQNDSGGSTSGGNVPPGVNYQGYSGVTSPYSKIRAYVIGNIRGVGSAMHAGTGFGGQTPYSGEPNLYQTIGYQTTFDLTKQYNYDQINAQPNNSGTYSLVEGHPDSGWTTHPATGYRRSEVGGTPGTDFGYGAETPGNTGNASNGDTTQQNSRQTNFATGASQHVMGTYTWVNMGGSSTVIPSSMPPSMPPGGARDRVPNCGCVIGPSPGYRSSIYDTPGSSGASDDASYGSYLRKELIAARDTINQRGTALGQFGWNMYDHPGSMLSQAWLAFGQAGDSAITWAGWAYQNPWQAVAAAGQAIDSTGRAGINYLDQLTLNPEVSGQLLGDGTIAWGVGGAAGILGGAPAAAGAGAGAAESAAAAEQLTLYHGTSSYVAEEMVANQAVNLERLAAHQLGKSWAPGLYTSSQESTAAYWAELANGSGRAGGPAIVKIEVPASTFNDFAAARNIGMDTPIHRMPGQVETFIPREHLPECFRLPGLRVSRAK